MTTYAEKQADISRTLISLVVITQDFCQNTFGSAPCTATGTKSFNTFHTCKSKSNFDRGTKDYKFTTAPHVPFHGVRPYLKDVRYIPTEIKDNLTVSARAGITLYDEPDNDIGIDPYVKTRAAWPDIPGTFWKKWLARNPNFKGRTVKIYEGYDGVAEVDYVQKFVGKIYNITLGRGEVRVEVEDLLQSLADIEVPAKIDCELVAAIDASQTTITVSDASVLDDPAAGAKWAIIDEEAISYTGRNTTTNQITGCTRGAYGTTAAAHSENDKVGKCRKYTGNPYDILNTEMLQADAGIPSADIDTTAFTGLKTFPVADIDYDELITEPTKLRDLFFEIVDLLDCKCWVGEVLKITIAKNLPNSPGRSYGAVTGAANIVHGSEKVDLKAEERKNQVILYWDKKPNADDDEAGSYNRIDAGVHADAQGANDMGAVVEEKIFCRWIKQGVATEEETDGYVTALLGRRLREKAELHPEVPLEVELKDSGLRTGQWISLATSALQNADGTDYTGEKFQIIKRRQQGNAILLSLKKASTRRIAYFAPASAPAYASATDAQKEYGFFCNAGGEMADESAGYEFY